MMDTPRTAATTAPQFPAMRLLRCLALDTRCELLRLLREPMYVIPTLLFPALFYAMFGLLLGSRGSGEAARYLLATYGVFGAMGAGLFGFAVTLAVDRERGLFALRRALPDAVAPDGGARMDRGRALRARAAERDLLPELRRRRHALRRRGARAARVRPGFSRALRLRGAVGRRRDVRLFRLLLADKFGAAGTCHR